MSGELHMKLPTNILEKIIGNLRPLNPESVILFGSYAWGEPGKDSDIDLYVVTRDEFIPSSFREKNEVYLNVARKLYEIEKEIPIDLIVHTSRMHRRFSELNGCFYRKLMKDGIVII
jgi:predicted nucleotidyltransferase